MLRILNSAKLTPEELAQLDGVPVLDPDRLDAAILGAMPNSAGELVVVYGYDELVDALAEDIGEIEETEEWVDYNTLRALPYMGPRAPVVLRRCEDPDDVGPEELIQFQGKQWVKA